MAYVLDLGFMEYLQCFDLQKSLSELRSKNKIADTLILVEHQPVLTLGSNFHESNLLHSVEVYKKNGIDIIKTDRGGDVTFHGPKQLVIYPIFDIRNYGRDVHKWLRLLEQTIIECLGLYGLEGYRFPPHTGVWVNDRKIAAIGIKISKWINTHGIALNCNNDLSPFALIIPCGIQGYGVTSLSNETGKETSVSDAKAKICTSFENVFSLSLHKITLDEIQNIQHTESA